MKYVAMDFETGNHDYLSACAIGLSYYEGQNFVSSESFYIRPPDCVGEFHWYNVKIHGIARAQLQNMPTFKDVWMQIRDNFDGSVILCHNAAFDTEVLCRCLTYYHLPLPNCLYLCTVKISQKVWPELKNHKLNTVSHALDIALHHHEAESDARACGEIFQCALRQIHAADAWELTERLGIQPGMISPTRRRGCSSKKVSNAL